MPKQIGEYRFKGTIDGLCFYKDNENFLVRSSNPTKREEFLSDKRFERSRWQNTEFAGAGLACRSVRSGLAEIEKEFADQYFHSRLRGALRKMMVAEGPKDMGMRPLLASKHTGKLHGLEMNAGNSFVRGFNCGLATQIVGEETTAILRTNPFIPRKALFCRPDRATHFQVVFCAVMLSDHFYNKELKGYAPALPKITGSMAKEQTGIMRLGDEVTDPLEMVCRLGIDHISSQAGVILLAGVKFYRMDAGVMRTMRKAVNCMGVVDSACTADK